MAAEKRFHSSSTSDALPSIRPIPRADIVQSLLPTFQSLLLTVPANQRLPLNSLWTALRPVISKLEAEKEAAIYENMQLRFGRSAVAGTMAAPSQQPSPTLATRPDSQSSIADAIQSLNNTTATLQLALEQNNLLSETLIRIYDMPPGKALNLLQTRRDTDTEQIHAKHDCWMKTPDANPYPKINLRNTTHHSGFGNYGIIFCHHLAVVANGKGEPLLSVVQSAVDGVQFQVSHLCGNERCFNPAHVEVENAQVNQARKTCFGRCHVDCGGCGSVYDVCPHARMDGSCGRDCILPRFKGEPCSYHRAVIDGLRVVEDRRK